jgi:2-hydroxychromene-2-carboxylate isomerase
MIETAEFSPDDLTILRAYEWDRINFTDPEKRRKTAAAIGVTDSELLAVRRDTLAQALGKIGHIG